MSFKCHLNVSSVALTPNISVSPGQVSLTVKVRPDLEHPGHGCQVLPAHLQNQTTQLIVWWLGW